MSAGRLTGLDALRAIAALCVVGLHANAIFPHRIPPVLAKGYLAVDFFLMLSGYLMARITEPRLAGGLGAGAFIRARFRRFWPVVTLGSLIGIPFLWVRTQADPLWFASALVANLAFVPMPADHLLFPLNVPVWTILAELAVNALHVALLWRLATGRLAWLVATAGVLALGVALDYGSLDVGARPSNALYAIPRVLFAYGLGMLLWRSKRDDLALPLPGWVAFVAMPAALLASWASGYRAWPFDLVFVALLCPLVIATALGFTRDNRLTRFSADISFPLFVAHVPVLEAARQAGYGPAMGLPAALAASLVILWWTKRRERRMEPAKA